MSKDTCVFYELDYWKCARHKIIECSHHDRDKPRPWCFTKKLARNQCSECGNRGTAGNSKDDLFRPFDAASSTQKTYLEKGVKYRCRNCNRLYHSVNPLVPIDGHYIKGTRAMRKFKILNL
jgi:hypothetical protein